jgi:regulator of replication initiation timing
VTTKGHSHEYQIGRLKGTIERLREENARLKAEVERLRKLACEVCPNADEVLYEQERNRNNVAQYSQALRALVAEVEREYGEQPGVEALQAAKRLL